MYTAPPIFNLLVIRSLDIDAAVSFYQTLGLVFTKHAHGSGPQHYAAETNACVFEIYPAQDVSRSTKGLRFGFRVDDVDSVVAMLAEEGYEVSSKPSDSPWGRRAVVHDFDGHVVELVTQPK